MIRKLTSYLLLFTYLSVSVGLYGGINYCGEEITGIEFFDLSGKDQCGESTSCCEDDSLPEEDESCCKTRIFTLDFAPERMVPKPAGPFFTDCPDIVVADAGSALSVSCADNKGEEYFSGQPPTGRVIPLYVSYCSLVFYG